MAGGCGDHDGVEFVDQAGVDDCDMPARQFAHVVAARAGATAVGVIGGSSVAVSGYVINVPDGCSAERVATSLVPQFDQVGEPALEAASGGIAADDRSWVGF